MLENEKVLEQDFKNFFLSLSLSYVKTLTAFGFSCVEDSFVFKCFLGLFFLPFYPSCFVSDTMTHLKKLLANLGHFFFHFPFYLKYHNSMTHSNDKYREKSIDVLLRSDCHHQGS